MNGLDVCFLCTHNSARSQMAEALLREDFRECSFPVRAHSAGVVARGVHPLAKEVLEEVGIETGVLRSKTVAEVTEPVGETSDGPRFDVVVTVCDNAREACPYLPAKLENQHHSFLDPSAVEGSIDEQREAFQKVRDDIRHWLSREVPRWLKLADEFRPS